MRSYLALCLFAGALYSYGQNLLAAAPVGTAFTYQGRLKSNGNPVNGSVNLSATLYDADSGGNQVGPTLNFDGVGTNPPPVAVTDGLFTVVLDFGAGAFTGERRWLQITVNGTPLTPRQEVAGAPYAQWARRADSAMTASSVPWSGITGVPASLSSASSPWSTISEVAGSGDNSYGQLDAPSGTYTAIAAGDYHAVAIRSDGTLAAWGDDSYGQTEVPTGTFIAVAAGSAHSIGIRSDGTLAGWGDSYEHEIDVPSGTFTAISASYYFNLAIRSDGTLVGWGFNGYGQTSVPAGTFTAVAGGVYYGLGLRSDGTLAGWGANSHGQTTVPAGTFIAVAAGLHHSVAIRSDGTLVGWGNNSFGQTNVPSGTFVAVVAGYYHSAAIRSDGTLVAWGVNNYGQTNLPSGRYMAVAAKGSYTLALRSIISSSGQVSFAGDIDVNGQISANALRLGTSTTPGNVLTADANGVGTWNSLSNIGSGMLASDAASLAQVSGGALTSLSGKVGIGTTDPKATLHVASATPEMRLEHVSTAKVYHIGIALDDDRLSIGENGAVEYMCIKNGNVGIGTGIPGSFKLAVNGDVAKPGGGLWSVFSDARLKHDIEPMKAGTLDKLLSLHGYTFEYDQEAIEKRLALPGRQTGMIAQEVEQVFPEWVSNDAEGYRYITERGTTALTIEALRELRAEKSQDIESLRAENNKDIESLRAENRELRARMEKLIKAMEEHSAVPTN